MEQNETEGAKQKMKRFLKQLSERVETHLKETETTAFQLSQDAKVDPHTIYGILKQEGNPTAKTIFAIAAVIKIDVELIDDEYHLMKG
jgi:DNA-binding phage protein